MIDRHLRALLMQERGDNRKLADEIMEKLSPESRDRLFRILQDHEYEVGRLKRRASLTSAAIASHISGMVR